MTKIFISYRREDSGMGAGRIYDRLEARFGAENLFFDIDSIPLGVDFRRYLDERIRSCNVMLAVIGHSWLQIKDESGQRRLDHTQDFVRTEIELALQRDIPVIPVLLDAVPMPTREDLPESIADLSYRNAARVDTLSFRPHMDRLIRGLEYLISTEKPKQKAADDLSRQEDKKSRAEELTATPVTPASRKQSLPQTDPVTERLLAELDDPDTRPRRRLAIGDELAKLGDPRPGVGLDERGLPDIDWVEIPAGTFIYGEGSERQEIDLKSFMISRYPITNSQYQCFINARGYQDERWWQDLKRPEPKKSTWDQPNRPKTDVDWYEALAFSRWLAAQTGQSIRLPTVQEWEKAARGTDGREYPWGNDYINGYANVDESDQKGDYLQETTAVGLYPKGESPYGVRDMAGNVWEWCLNKWEHPERIEPDSSGDSRVLRGGCWFYDPEGARAAYRVRDNPDSRLDFRGFRVLLSAPII